MRTLNLAVVIALACGWMPASVQLDPTAAQQAAAQDAAADADCCRPASDPHRAPIEPPPGGPDSPAFIQAYDGLFPNWINGGRCQVEPKLQVHQYNEDTYILRQSLCTNFEGPFIYLLFGQEKVLMQDTGANSTGVDLYGTVNGIIQNWLVAHNKRSIELVVSHSHAHGDHVAMDAQFTGKPNTVVVGKSAAAVQSFFGITNWPTQTVAYDLGERIVDVIPLPGHEPSHIALYDRETHLLFTGDSLYSGRLYFPKSQFATYKASIQRLVDFTADKPVKFVLGTHIEMTKTPGKDFPIGSTYHPDEHALQLSKSHLLELHAALQAMATPVKEVHDDFIIYPL